MPSSGCQRVNDSRFCRYDTLTTELKNFIRFWLWTIKFIRFSLFLPSGDAYDARRHSPQQPHLPRRGPRPVPRVPDQLCQSQEVQQRREPVSVKGACRTSLKEMFAVTHKCQTGPILVPMFNFSFLGLVVTIEQQHWYLVNPLNIIGP